MKFDTEDGIELWLLGWSQSHNGGCKVTFQITEETLELFRNATVKAGKHAGQRYAALLVQLDENDKPVPKEPAKKADAPATKSRQTPAITATSEQKESAKEPAKHHPHFPAGLCGLAVKWCDDEHFQEWCAFTYPELWSQQGEVRHEVAAAGVVKAVCGVASRKVLDEDHAAGEKFKLLIKEPYVECRQADGID